MSDKTPFELSRLYAQGWLAARDCQTDATADLQEALMAAQNPYESEVERERWAQGFKDALIRAEQTSSRKKKKATV